MFRTTRVTLRSVAAAMISTISGWTVGSPPDSISASTLPPSRSIAVSSERRMCGSRACRLSPGPLSAKQVGQCRLQFCGDVEQQDAAVLRLEVAETVQVAHRDRPDVVGDVGRDLAGRDAPALQALPQVVVLLVQAHDLAVAALAVAAQVDGAVHRDEVALEDVRLVVDLAVGIVAEALAADGQDHPKRQVRPQRERHRTVTNGRHVPATPRSRTTGTASNNAMARELRSGSG